MSLSIFHIESTISNIVQAPSPANYMNTSMLETSQLLPSLQDFPVSVPTAQEIEQLSFFDEWLASDCSKVTTPIDDFEITPIHDMFNPLGLIDSSMLYDFPSPESLAQLSFLSDISDNTTYAPNGPIISFDYSHNVQQESLVNIQLPSPAQTPRTSPLFSKQIFQEPSSNVQVAHNVSSNNKRTCTDESDCTITKRRKNTDAARRSRQRKVTKINELDKRTSELLSENTRLSTKVAILESEKKHRRQKELELQIRIQTLESQLTESHRILTDC